jgi:hypothetical protein
MNIQRKRKKLRQATACWLLQHLQPVRTSFCCKAFADGNPVSKSITFLKNVLVRWQVLHRSECRKESRTIARNAMLFAAYVPLSF